MDAGVAPADVRPGWLSHRDVSHSWLAGIPPPAAYFMPSNAVGCRQVLDAQSWLAIFSCSRAEPCPPGGRGPAKVLLCSQLAVHDAYSVQVWCSFFSSSAPRPSSMWCARPLQSAHSLLGPLGTRVVMT